MKRLTLVLCFLFVSGVSDCTERFDASRSLVVALDHLYRANCILGYSKPPKNEPLVSFPNSEGKLIAVINECNSAWREMAPYLSSEDAEASITASMMIDHLQGFRHPFEVDLKSFRDKKLELKNAGKKVPDVAMWKDYQDQIGESLDRSYRGLGMLVGLCGGSLKKSLDGKSGMSKQDSAKLVEEMKTRYGVADSKDFKTTDAEKSLHYLREIFEKK